MIEPGGTSTLGHAKRFTPRRRVIAVLLYIVCAATTARAQTVTYTYDPAATFSQYKTYAWSRGTELTDANHERVLRTIDAALVGKGLARVEPTGNPDVLVAYHASFEIDGAAGDGSAGLGGYHHGGVVQRFLVVTVIIDMTDARTGATVWQSHFNCDMRLNSTPESRGKNITKATETMFKDYPPKPDRPGTVARNAQRR